MNVLLSANQMQWMCINTPNSWVWTRRSTYGLWTNKLYKEQHYTKHRKVIQEFFIISNVEHQESEQCALSSGAHLGGRGIHPLLSKWKVSLNRPIARKCPIKVSNCLKCPASRFISPVRSHPRCETEFRIFICFSYFHSTLNTFFSDDEAWI